MNILIYCLLKTFLSTELLSWCVVPDLFLFRLSQSIYSPGEDYPAESFEWPDGCRDRHMGSESFTEVGLTRYVSSIGDSLRFLPFIEAVFLRIILLF